MFSSLMFLKRVLNSGTGVFASYARFIDGLLSDVHFVFASHSNANSLLSLEMDFREH